MLDVRRIVVAVLAVLGLAVACVGVWLAAIVGPSGTATFTGSSTEPLVLTPDTLNRVDSPVTIDVSTEGTQVWLGRAVPSDVTDAVGAGQHYEVTEMAFPSRELRTTIRGDVTMADPVPLHVWRDTVTGTTAATMVLEQADAPESVLVNADGPVRVSLTVANNRWFLEALILVVAGLAIAGFGGGYLFQHLQRTGALPSQSPRSQRPRPSEQVGV